MPSWGMPRLKWMLPELNWLQAYNTNTGFLAKGKFIRGNIGQKV